MGSIYRMTAGPLVYYGSTTQKINQRFSQHKYNYKRGKCYTSNKLFASGLEVKIEEIEKVKGGKKELKMREKHWILNNECVNRAVSKEVNYGIIYRMVAGTLVYYGSTTDTIKNRYNGHRGDYKRGRSYTASKLFESGLEVKIEEVEKVYELNELDTRERYYIENFECVNKIIPGQTYDELRELVRERQNKKVKCGCGYVYTSSNKSRHCKSKKHLDWVATAKPEHEV